MNLVGNSTLIGYDGSEDNGFDSGCGISMYNIELIIDSSTGGSLTTTGGRGCAGIGFSQIDNSTLTINGGNITATGGYKAAGIGGNSEKGTNPITINGGNITATGGTFAPGIGGGVLGDRGSVIINGGIVTTSSTGYDTAGIGMGYHGSGGSISITGGEVYIAGDGDGSSSVDNGDISYGSTVSISNNAVVFLKNNIIPTPTTDHTLFSYETIVGNSAYGYTNIPASWSGTAYAYIYQTVFVIDDAYIARASSTVDLNGILATVNTIQIDTTQAITIMDSEESSREIEIKTLCSDVDLTIEDIHLDVNGVALDFTGTNNTLTLTGHSSLASASSKPAISVETSESLTISSSTSGSLNAVGSVGSTGGTVNVTSGQIYSNAYNSTLNISGDSAVFGENASSFNTISTSSHTYVDSDNINNQSAYGYIKFPASWSGKAYGYIKTPILVNFYDEDGSTLLDTLKVAEGQKLSKPSTPQKNGYSSLWYSNSDLSDASKWDFDAATVTTAIDLYVKWTMNTYTIDFTLNGGTNNVQNPSDYNIFDGTITLLEASKTGYTFEGWYDNPALNGSAVTTLDTSDAENKEFFAKFSANSATVSFDGNGNTSGSSPSDILSQTDTIIALPDNTGGLENIGFIYKGWSESESGTAISGNYAVPAGGATLYAVWLEDTSVPSYTVTFNAQDGSSIDSQTIPKGAHASKPNNPTRDGFTFSGWYTSSDCNDDDRWNFNTSPIIQNTTLFAKWTAVGNTSSSSGSSTKTVVVNEFTTEIPSSYIGKDKVFEVESDEAKVSVNGLSLEKYKGDDVEIFIQKIDADYFNFDGVGEFPEGMEVFDISLIVDGVKVPFESDIPLEIELEIDGDYEKHKMVAIYLANDGSYEILEGVYDGEKLIFKTNHLSNYSIVYADKTFDDVNTHWGKEAIEALASREVVNGVGNDLFNPDGEITRAEFITIMVRYFDLAAYGTDLGYTDIKEDSWYAEHVWTARENGILPEIYGDTFEPNKAITREEMMYILYKSLEVADRLDTLEDNGDKLSDFTDSNIISDYAIEGSGYLISRDIINGSGDGKFNPTSTSTRAEVVQMIWNMINLVKY